MKFAHIADCHVGNWRDAKMKELVIESFEKTIDLCLAEDVDFIIIAGDLFHTALPGIDLVKRVFSKLREVKDAGIPMYYVAGSHDYSPSGKTMLDVIEKADLGRDVMRGDVVDDKLRLEFTEDETGAKLTGLIGKRGLLERRYYKDLDRASLEEEDGFKIFLFHTALDEMKPEELEKMDSNPMSFLPEGFDYYAGGHVHIVERYDREGYENVVYPGPVFPANFRELERLGHGGFYIYEDGDLEYQDIVVKDTVNIHVEVEGSLVECEKAIQEKVDDVEVEGKIVLLRVEGVIEDGSTSDLDLHKHVKTLQENGAFRVLKKTTGLKSEGFEEVKRSFSDNEDVEDEIIHDNISDKDLFKDESDTFKALIKELGSEKKEGETNKDYESRIKENVETIIEKEMKQ